MYPNYPESPSDLVPLPRCDGPKLKPFDFQGPQKIEFLEYLGWGLHSHVFKVKVLGKIYALKLVSEPCLTKNASVKLARPRGPSDPTPSHSLDSSTTTGWPCPRKPTGRMTCRR